MTWNLTRLVGPSLPFCAFASISRTLRARIGISGASSSRRGVWGFRRRLPLDEDFECEDLDCLAVDGMLLLSVCVGMNTDGGSTRC